MYDKVINDSRVYTDVQGMDELKGKLKSNPEAVKKEVAHQFSSLLVQMLMKSMREANAAFSSDLFSSSYMDYYQDFFDKQISLSISNRDIGLESIIEKNIDQQLHLDSSQLAYDNTIPTTSNNAASDTNIVSSTAHKQSNQAVNQPEPASINVKNDNIFNAGQHEQAEKQTIAFHTPKEFIQSLWQDAKEAAAMIGVSPAMILAQAALETNWGKKILKHADGTSSFNLFNIKAGTNWSKPITQVETVEQKDGVLVKEKSAFRSYQSFKESFHDYVQYIKNHIRHFDTVNNAYTPHNYFKTLQKAGYATDTGYADKIVKILSSKTFNELIQGVE